MSIPSKEFDLPVIGRVVIRYAAGVEVLRLEEAQATAETKVASWEALCAFIDACILSEDVPSMVTMPIYVVTAAQKAVFEVSKINAPGLEEIGEGEEYVTHEEAAAENF